MAFADPQPKVLFFDVFGTCVDWRKTVTQTLQDAGEQALARPDVSVDENVRLAASNTNWGEVAHEWRQTYLKYTRAVANDPSIAFKTVDEHYLHALYAVLRGRGLVLPRADIARRAGADSEELIAEGSLWTEDQILELSLVWHRLEPWPDTVRGLEALNQKFTTITLSNGNISLLQDMVSNGCMPLTDIYSAEMFHSYKPNPSVYLGAAKKIGLEPSECAMVAAHLDDLKHAKEAGFKAIYVERTQEERCPELRDGGFVDVWVNSAEDGFIAAAEKLGITWS